MDNIPVQRKSKVIMPIEQLDVRCSYFHRFIYVYSVYLFDLRNTPIKLVFSLNRSSRYVPKLPLFTIVSNNPHCEWCSQSWRLLTQPSSSASLLLCQIIVSSASGARGLKASTSSTSSSSSSSIISPLVLPAALALRLPPTLESLGPPAEMPPLLLPMESKGPRKGFFFRFAKTTALGEARLADSL